MNRSVGLDGVSTPVEHFADQLLLLAALEPGAMTEQVLAAFRNVPREAFAGPGPWLVRSPLAAFSLPPRWTPVADPRWLYHNALVVLDESKGINTGELALWAHLLARAGVTPDAHILQIGAGVGYYTAILRHLAAARGCVLACEAKAALAERSSANLSSWEGVTLRHGNAATDLGEDGPFDLVVAFAGVTQIPSMWSEKLAPECPSALAADR